MNIISFGIRALPLFSMPFHPKMSSSIPPLVLHQLPKTPAEILAAAVKAEVNECCVCLEPLNSFVLLSCNVKTLYGPFHAVCK